MLITLERFSYSKDETEGVLTLSNGRKFATIERPWVENPNGAKGGKPFASCIPDGMYRLMPHESKSKGEVYIIINENLGVYAFQRPEGFDKSEGRRLCYLHKANWAWQLEGCIAPGLRRLPMKPTGQETMPAVTSSGASMGMLIAALGRNKNHVLSITSVLGAKDV